VIEFQKLTKSYGPLTAVDALDLTIDEGCVFGFIGRNGAGKTTTIRMMMGLLEPTSGTVVIGGHDVRREPEKAKALTGYLPDHPFLYDKLSSCASSAVCTACPRRCARSAAPGCSPTSRSPSAPGSWSRPTRTA
jgi:ABC-type multidrug transport system ATPase subunit